jgi:hypothetical protein
MDSYILWMSISPYIKDISILWKVCNNSRSVLYDPLILARWLDIHKHDNALRHAFKSGDVRIAHILYDIHNHDISTNILYDMVINDHNKISICRAFDFFKKYSSADNMRYTVAICFVLVCMHGKTDVAKILLNYLEQPDRGLRVLSGLKDQEWMDIVDLIGCHSANAIDIGLEMARKGRHRGTIIFLQKRRRQIDYQYFCRNE